MSALYWFKTAAALLIIAAFIWLGVRMASPGGVNTAVDWAITNKAAVRKSLGILQIVAGLALCLLGYAGGHQRLHLILNGTKTEGRVVSYRQVHMSNGGAAVWTYAALPTVVFQLNGASVHFEDSMGTADEVLNLRVPVLYDAQQPSLAIIDRPVMNWIPWAPMIAVGALLLLSRAKRQNASDSSSIQ